LAELQVLEANLSRIVHTAPIKLQTAFNPSRPWREQVGEVGVRAIESLLGVGVVQAQPSASIGAAGGATANALPGGLPGGLPGALGLPQDKQALIDHRYLWDAAGNLRLVQDKQSHTGYAYDRQDRLIVEQQCAGELAEQGPQVQQTSTGRESPSKPQRLGRYYYDAQGRRVLSQEVKLEGEQDASSSEQTVKVKYAQGAHQASTSGQGEMAYDAAGQPRSQGKRRFHWDAYGRLALVDGDVQASYRYDHQGLRTRTPGAGFRTGTVNMAGYVQWLRDHGYNLGSLRVQ
jgi:hypothetical protein